MPPGYHSHTHKTPSKSLEQGSFSIHPRKRSRVRFLEIEKGSRRDRCIEPQIKFDSIICTYILQQRFSALFSLNNNNVFFLVCNGDILEKKSMERCTSFGKGWRCWKSNSIVYIYIYMYYEISLVNRSVFREKVNALRKNKRKRGIRDIKNWIGCIKYESLFGNAW